MSSLRRIGVLIINIKKKYSIFIYLEIENFGYLSKDSYLFNVIWEKNMKSLSTIGLGLSVVFGCLLLALAAEVYYLLWWRKKIIKREIENDYRSPIKELFYMFCWKRPSSSSLRQTSVRSRDTLSHDPEGQQALQTQNSNDFLFKPFGENGMEQELEFIRQQEFSGPPRFLFTIVEETKEDLESEDGRKDSRKLNDFLSRVETPYLTPLASPHFRTPPATSIMTPYNQDGFNPRFEAASDAEFNRIRSSPPPKFKFLQDAEEKLKRKLNEESEGKDNEADGSFITS